MKMPVRSIWISPISAPFSSSSSPPTTPSFRLARAAFLVIMAECTAHGRSLPRREGFAPHFPLCAITINPHRGSISLFAINNDARQRRVTIFSAPQLRDADWHFCDRSYRRLVCDAYSSPWLCRIISARTQRKLEVHDCGHTFRLAFLDCRADSDFAGIVCDRVACTPSSCFDSHADRGFRWDDAHRVDERGQCCSLDCHVGPVLDGLRMDREAHVGEASPRL